MSSSPEFFKILLVQAAQDRVALHAPAQWKLSALSRYGLADIVTSRFLARKAPRQPARTLSQEDVPHACWLHQGRLSRVNWPSGLSLWGLQHRSVSVLSPCSFLWAKAPRVGRNTSLLKQPGAICSLASGRTAKTNCSSMRCASMCFAAGPWADCRESKTVRKASKTNCFKLPRV